jgi:hypothetical protein
MAKVSLSLGKSDRTCADCTKCCEGWLSANILGEDMFPGKPCQFVTPDVGCTIYKDRPKDPCKTFECAWRATDYIPLEFSPVNTGQIVVPYQLDGIDFLSMVFAGKEVDPKFLSWFVTFAVGRQLNVEWSIDGQLYALGSQDFMEARARRDKENEIKHNLEKKS